MSMWRVFALVVKVMQQAADLKRGFVEACVRVVKSSSMGLSVAGSRPQDDVQPVRKRNELILPE